MFKTFPIVLDITNHQLNDMFQVNSNDLNTVKLSMTIKSGLDIFDLTGKIVRIAVKKPDGFIAFQTGGVIDPSIGLCEFILDRQAYLVEGKHEAEVMIYQDDSTVIVTERFYYKVNRAIVNDKTLISTNHLPAINQAIIAGEQLKDIDIPEFVEAANSAYETIEEAETQGLYAKGQGDYAKQEADRAAARVTELNGVDAVQFKDKQDKLSAQMVDIAIQLTDYCTLDGVNDDSNGLEIAYNKAKTEKRVLYLPTNKTLTVKRNVSLHGVNLDFKGQVRVDFNGTGITIGGLKVKQYFRQANSTNPAWITLRVTGGYQSNFEIGECTYLQMWADSDLDSDYGGSIPYARFTAYNTFNLGVVPKLEFNRNPNPKNTAVLQWINENTFKRGAYRNLSMLGDNLVPNNNVFDHPTFEDATLYMESGSANHFRDCRFEGTTNVITLGVKTNDNIIEKLYTETLISSFSDELGAGTVVTDNGSGNIIARSQWQHYEMNEIFSLTAKNRIFNTSTDVEGYKDGIQAGLHKLKVSSGGKQVYKSPIIPLPTYGNLGINLGSDVQVWSYRIYVYDANLKPIKTEPDSMGYVQRSASTLSFNTNGYYISGSYLKNLDTVIRNPDGKLKYIQIYVESGSAGTWFERLNVSLQYLKHNRKMYGPAVRKDVDPIVSGAILQGFARKGGTVYLDTGGYYQCVSSVDAQSVSNNLSGGNVVYIKGETTLSTNTLDAGSTATILKFNSGVSAPDGYYANMTILVNNEERVITAYNGTTKEATLDRALSSVPAAGTSYTPYTSSSVMVGDVVGILQEDLSTHWTTVSAVDKTKITLAGALTVNADAGRRVVFNRWSFKNPIIASSPDGSKWNITIGNDGALTTTKL